MDEKNKQVLNKIYHHILSVLSYCENCQGLEEFQSDSMRVEACVFNLMQIGELSKTVLADEVKNSIKSVPWNQIYGMRNRIVHGYSGVDMSVVWDTISDDLPKLMKEMEKYLK